MNMFIFYHLGSAAFQNSYALYCPEHPGTESVRFKGSQLWQMLPQTIRNSGSLAQFKANIKDWKGEIVHASCVALSFRTWAFYDVF